MSKKTMNPIDTIINAVSATDDYTQASVFGACHWQAAGAAINYALRIISNGEPEEASGIDGFARWMERISALNAQEMADLKSLGTITDRFGALAGEVMMDAPTIESSIATRIKLFAPTMEGSEKRYTDLRRKGERFTVSKATWVADDYKKQVEQHSQLVNNADTISGLINRAMRDDHEAELSAWSNMRKTHSHRPDGSDQDMVEYGRVPEWLFERLTEKACEKLFERYDKTSARANSTTLKSKARMDAQADLFRISTALKALGEVPPVITYVDEDGNPESFARVVQKGKRIEMEFSDTLF
jgi:hypothetical protein